MNLKYKLRLFVAVLLAAVVTTSCDTAGSEGTETPTEKIDAFKLITSGSSVDNLSVKVTADDAVENYIVALMERSIFASDYDSSLTAAADGATTSLVADKNIEFGVADDKYVFNGNSNVNLATSWELKQGTSYVVLVYGINDLGAQTTNVAYKNVSTQRVSEYSDYSGYIFLNEINPNEDWVEIYSKDRESVNLEGFYLMNEDGDKVELTGDIAQDTHLVFDLSVNAHGDEITLYDDEDKIVDEILTTEVGASASYGREADGSDNWKEFELPSKGEKNGFIMTEGEPFEVEELYAANDQIAYIVRPDENIGVYSYIFADKDSFETNYNGSADALAEDGVLLYKELLADYSAVNGVTMFHGTSIVDPAAFWGVEEGGEYVYVFFGLNEEGDRNTKAVMVESKAEGTHEPTDEEYKKWIGTWSVSCSSYAGRSYTFDVTIDAAVDDYTYNIGGFDANEAGILTGYLDKEGNIFILSSNFLFYSTQIEGGGPDGNIGEFNIAAYSLIGNKMGLVSGNYPAITIASESDGKAVATGYEGELQGGGTFEVTHFGLCFFILNDTQFYSYGMREEFQDDNKKDDAPKGPYTFTKTSDEIIVPDEPASAPSRAMGKNIGSTLMNRTISKAMNAPKSLEVARAILNK